MEIKKWNLNLTTAALITSIYALTFSCETKPKHDIFSPLPLGEIKVEAMPDTGACNTCFHFTTSSNLVAEPQGGIIKIDESVGDEKGTVVMYSGGLGNWYFSDFDFGARLNSELTLAGYRVIQVRYDSGWFIGSTGNFEGFKKLAVHPATVTKYIYDELTDHQKPFVLFGGSGGAAQIAYILSFYGIDTITSSAVIFGGFWMGRLDIGCFDKDTLNYYMHYSDRAKSYIDLSFGFGMETKGPCELCDTTYLDLYKENSVSYGGNYFYPNSQVYLIYGGNDGVGALNQGLTYYYKLAESKSPKVQMQVIDGASHGILGDSIGYSVLRNILLKQITSR